jgi:hypothetical protein
MDVDLVPMSRLRWPHARIGALEFIGYYLWISTKGIKGYVVR